MRATPLTAIRSVVNLRRGRGFTMVEMLVALVVLAVGMLGVAGLFVVSLRSGGTANSRMQAVNLVSDMADRIRSNRRAEEVYTRTEGLDRGCTGDEAENCTPEQMAETDVFLWKRQIATLFPGGRAEGTVEFQEGEASDEPSFYTITLEWAEQGQADDEDESRLSYSARVQVIPTW